MGNLYDNSFTLVRNNIPQLNFYLYSLHEFYLEKGDEGGYIGMQSLTDSKKFGIFLGNNRNMITWKNGVNQPIRFSASTGFLFTLERTISMTMTATNGILV